MHSSPVAEALVRRDEAGGDRAEGCGQGCGAVQRSPAARWPIVVPLSPVPAPGHPQCRSSSQRPLVTRRYQVVARSRAEAESVADKAKHSDSRTSYKTQTSHCNLIAVVYPKRLP